MNHFKSAVVNKTRKLKKIAPEARIHGLAAGKRKTQIAKRNPVKASTNGYCHEIGREQEEQRPLRNKKLKRGTFSYHARG